MPTTPDALTRRSLLYRGGGLALALTAPGLLAACGAGGSGGAAGGGTVTSGVRSAAQGPSAGAAAPGARGRLDFLGYEGDDIPDFTKAWKRRAGVDLKAAYISSESEIEAKLLGGGGQGVDLLSLTSPAAPYLLDEGLMAPIDPDKVPNLAHLWPFFQTRSRGSLINDAGQWVAIPTFWGSIGLAWDASVVKNVTAWKDILDPAFKDNVAIIDDPALPLFAACAVLDLDPDRLTTSDLDRVRDWLRPVLAQAKTFAPTFGDLISLLGSREVAAAFPGFTFIAGGAIAQGNADARYNIQLEEGYPVLIEAYALAPDADNPDAALAFINEQLTPNVQAKIATLQGAATVVDNATDLLPKEIRALYPYDDLAAFYASAKLFTNPPRKSDRYVTQSQISDMWTALKQDARA